MYKDSYREPYAMDYRDAAQVQASIISGVYGWMTLALVITGLVAMVVASTPDLMKEIFSNRLLFFGLIAAEFIAVISLIGLIKKMSAATATAVFVLYAVLNGVTFSIIFLIYTLPSIASTFLVTAGTFGVMSAYGYFTKRDLTTIGNLCFMALIGLIIGSVVNIFWANSYLYWIITYAGVLIFVGLIAYDTQKIKEMCNKNPNAGAEIARKLAIIGALTLYLDFINLFILLLRIFGGRRN